MRVSVEPAVVRTSDLSIGYAAHGPSPAHVAISGLTLTIGPGEVLGVIGDAGSGKSSLARVLGGRSQIAGRSGVRPRIIGGQAWVLGHPLRNPGHRRLRVVRRRVGYLAQDDNQTLPPDFTAGQIVAMPIYVHDRKADVRATELAVATLMDAVELPLRVIDMYPYELSKGQRQRVAIARSLVLDPPLLITDEPTAGIDPSARGAVTRLVSTARSEQGRSSVIISNDLSLLGPVATRVAVLHKGLLVGYGVLEDVLRDRRHPYIEKIAAHHEFDPV